MKRFVKANTNDISLTVLQNNLDDTLSPLYNNPQLDNNIIYNITFIANQDTVISHGLHKNYTGWTVISKNNFSDFKLSETKNTSPQKTIILVSSSSVVASISFF